MKQCYLFDLKLFVKHQLLDLLILLNVLLLAYFLIILVLIHLYLDLINDHPDMRKIFDGFAMEMVNINYTIGGSGKGQNRRELIFKNW